MLCAYVCLQINRLDWVPCCRLRCVSAGEGGRVDETGRGLDSVLDTLFVRDGCGPQEDLPRRWRKTPNPEGPSQKSKLTSVSSPLQNVWEGEMRGWQDIISRLLHAIQHGFQALLHRQQLFSVFRLFVPESVNRNERMFLCFATDDDAYEGRCCT